MALFAAWNILTLQVLMFLFNYFRIYVIVLLFHCNVLVPPGAVKPYVGTHC